MLNEAAQKLVAREARRLAQQEAPRLQHGATVDELLRDAWQQVPEQYRVWSGAYSYFESVFVNEIERD
jgi:hypothetical protein